MFGATAEHWRETCEQLTTLVGVMQIEVFPDDDDNDDNEGAVIVHVWVDRCEAVDAVLALSLPKKQG